MINDKWQLVPKRNMCCITAIGDAICNHIVYFYTAILPEKVCNINFVITNKKSIKI